MIFVWTREAMDTTQIFGGEGLVVQFVEKTIGLAYPIAKSPGIHPSDGKLKCKLIRDYSATDILV